MTFRSPCSEHMLQLTPSYIVEDSAKSPHLLTGQVPPSPLRTGVVRMAFDDDDPLCGDEAKAPG